MPRKSRSTAAGEKFIEAVEAAINDLGLPLEEVAVAVALGARQKILEAPVFPKELVYLGKFQWGPKGLLPQGHIIVAWRPLIPVNVEKISVYYMGALMTFLDDRVLTSSLLGDSKRHLMDPDGESKRINDLVKNCRSAINKRKMLMEDNFDSMRKQIREVTAINKG